MAENEQQDDEVSLTDLQMFAVLMSSGTDAQKDEARIWFDKHFVVDPGYGLRRRFKRVRSLSLEERDAWLHANCSKEVIDEYQTSLWQEVQVLAREDKEEAAKTLGTYYLHTRCHCYLDLAEVPREVTEYV